MIEAVVTRNEEVLLETTYSDLNMSLEQVIKKLEFYVIEERLNEVGECLVKARFSKHTKENKIA